MAASSITYACGHKETLTVNPSPQRRKAMRTYKCHDCAVYEARRERERAYLDAAFTRHQLDYS